MANQQKQNVNPFEDEKPQLVHLEKDQTHYEYCRMQMHEIEHVHRRTFFCNLGLCMVVCILAVFRVYVGGFDLLSGSGLDESRPATVLVVGIFQIIFSMIVILLGYLAWANYRSLNIILEMWYVIVAVIGIVRLDYITGLVGAVGIVFYYFSIRELRREESLAHMDGYPEFHEKLDMSNSDYVVQTLLAHKGERLSRKKKNGYRVSDYSLRKTKKRSDAADTSGDERDAGLELAQELQKHISEANEKKQTAESAAQKPAAKTEPAAEQAPAEMPDAIDAPEADAKQAATFTDADAIMAEAEARAKEIIAEAVAKAQSVKEQAAAETPKKPNGGGNKKRK